MTTEKLLEELHSELKALNEKGTEYLSAIDKENRKSHQTLYMDLSSLRVWLEKQFDELNLQFKVIMESCKALGSLLAAYRKEKGGEG